MLLKYYANYGWGALGVEAAESAAARALALRASNSSPIWTNCPMIPPRAIPTTPPPMMPVIWQPRREPPPSHMPETGTMRCAGAVAGKASVTSIAATSAMFTRRWLLCIIMVVWTTKCRTAARRAPQRQ